ncbi:uncharacterized protein METZ01_LOCUS315413 [marine metagenome]|uniref:Uncharacterized protein n=1 Tax=marine metagenome TaxID=408172 RepID=A0A382NMX5_9ZZZZ
MLYPMSLPEYDLTPSQSLGVSIGGPSHLPRKQLAHRIGI